MERFSVTLVSMVYAGDYKEGDTMDAKIPTTKEKLTHFWSVRLPHRLDPWAPKLADALADGTWTGAALQHTDP